MAIRRPGVEITQEFVSESPTVVTPSLFPVIVGPCWQIVDAFDDDGETQTEAYAGTYQDGNGTVSYDLPGLTEDADVDEDEIRVFLLLGDDSTELNGESGEEEIVEGSATSTYTWDGSATTASFEDSATPGTFVTTGVEVGDYLRLSFQGETYDLEITAVGSETTLTVSAGIEDTSVEVSSYSIVRDPAQFVYQSSVANASISIGDETDYITFTAQTSAAEGNYSGAAGDTLSVIVSETTALDSGTSGVSGEYLFYTGTDASLTTAVGSIGTVTGFGLIFDASVGGDTGESGDIVVPVTEVISDYALALDDSGTDEAAGTSSKAYAVLEQRDASSTDQTYSVSDSGVVTAFAATVDWSGVDSALSGGTYVWYLEISGDGTSGVDGVYEVASGDSAGQLTLSIGSDFTNTAGDDGAATLWKVVVDGITGSDGNNGALTQFAASGLDFGSETVADYDVVVTASDDTETGYTVSSWSSSSLVVTLSDAVAAGADEIVWELQETSTDLLLTLDADENTVTVLLPRTDGLSTITMPNLVTAITDDSDSDHDADVFVEITAAASTSSGTVTYADAGTYELDGGVDADGVLLDEDLLGSTTPIGKIYISYKALRLDVSDQADDASVLKFSSTTDLETDLGPISTDNPLALGIYYALLNCPGREVKAIGVSAVSTAQSSGTTSAYTSALEFLEGENVYAMVPLTQDPEIHALFDSHVEAMSEPENKHERICFFSKALPEYSAATLLASGTSGNTEDDFISDSTAEDYGLFSTGVDLSNTSDLADALTAGETIVLVVSSTSSNTASDTQAYGTSTDKYGLLVDSVDSDPFVLTLDSASLVASAALDDGTDWDGMVDVAWAIYSVGSAITSASDQAERVAGFGEVYANRRTFVTWPSDLSASLSGTDVLLTGEYLAAAWAGKVGKEKVQQGFTNTAVTGFSTIKYSNGYFTESQLDDIAGGGTFITYQNSESAPLKCRHQLSTDVSSVQKRELSITKIIDYVAKQFRSALTGKIGVNNLTQSFLDALSTQIQGLLGSLTDQGVLTGGSLTDLSIDEDAPDTLNITLLITVPFPCNYIALTLQI